MFGARLHSTPRSNQAHRVGGVTKAAEPRFHPNPTFTVLTAAATTTGITIGITTDINTDVTTDITTDATANTVPVL